MHVKWLNMDVCMMGTGKQPKTILLLIINPSNTSPTQPSFAVFCHAQTSRRLLLKQTRDVLFAYANAVIIYQVPKQKNQGGYWKSNTRILPQDSAGSANTMNQSSTVSHLLPSPLTPKSKKQAQSTCKDLLFQKESIWPPLYMTDDGYTEAEALQKQVQILPLV